MIRYDQLYLCLMIYDDKWWLMIINYDIWLKIFDEISLKIMINYDKWWKIFTYGMRYNKLRDQTRQATKKTHV